MRVEVHDDDLSIDDDDDCTHHLTASPTFSLHKQFKNCRDIK